MEELSIEQKARNYDEAIKRGSQLWESDAITRENYEYIFPELVESGDKRMIKFIKQQLFKIKKAITENYELDAKLTKAIDWLEKKGEQKPTEEYNITGIGSKNAQGKLGEMIKNMESTNKVEPKFKVGDWVINTITKEVEQVIKLTEYEYICSEHLIISFNNQHLLRRWAIEDAKDGDVLCCESGWTCIFKALDNHTNTFSSYCFIDSYKWFCNTGSECHTLDKAFIKAYNGEIYPATKEQRDLLFQKIHEAGYEWDAEKKELRKIKQKSWSEEDEKMFDIIISDLERHGGKEGFCYLTEINFLKSLKDRVQNFTVTDEELAQAKKDAYNDALNKIEYHSDEPTFDDGWSAAIWYLRKRNVQPQNTWKPSNEHYELEEFAKIVRSNLTGISKAVQELFEAKYLQLTGNKMYKGFKD